MIRTPLRGPFTCSGDPENDDFRKSWEEHICDPIKGHAEAYALSACVQIAQMFLKVWLLVYAEVTWLLIIHINLLSAVGLGAILAPTPMLRLLSTLLGDTSPSIPRTPVQITTWYTISNVVPATRFTLERQEDAWEIDLESTYVQHDKATPIFL